MQEFLIQVLSKHEILAPLIFIVVRSTSVIFPPIPGIVFDIPGILVFGPWLGFVLGEAGIMLGAIVAFWIARLFREPVVKRFASLQKISKWEDTISEKKKFWALVALRLPTNAIFDYISYAAGLTKISSLKFFFSTLLGNIPSMFLVYFLGGWSFQRGIYYAIVFLVILFIFWFIFRKKLTPTRSVRSNWP